VKSEPGDDVTNLVHVRARDEIKAAEEIAPTEPVQGFEKFRPVLKQFRVNWNKGSAEL